MEKSEIKQQKAIEKINKPYKSKMRFYRFVVGIYAFFSRISVKVTGKENVPMEGPLFVCANHLSNWDPIWLAAAVGRPMHYMAKKEVFEVPVLNKLLHILGAFPVDREAADITAIKTAFTHIKFGNAVGIFPQGTRCMSQPPESIPVKSGVGMMVFRTRTDVLPVSIYTKDYKMSFFKKVYVDIGKPIKFAEYGECEKNPEEYQRISDTIFGRICEQVKNAKEAHG